MDLKALKQHQIKVAWFVSSPVCEDFPKESDAPLLLLGHVSFLMGQKGTTVIETQSIQTQR